MLVERISNSFYACVYMVMEHFQIVKKVTKNHEVVCASLKKLRELGISITLDDFGTGRSSITYLKGMPLDGIKIARTFIQSIETSVANHEKHSVSLIKAFADLAQNLHLNLLAEGIKTEEQHKFLLNLGCSIGQGFFFSPPIPASKAQELLTQTNILEFGIT